MGHETNIKFMESTKFLLILFGVFLFFGRPALADWIYYGASAAGNGDFFYNDKNLKISDGKVRVWVRQKREKRNEWGDGSVLYLDELDCEERTNTLLQVEFFSDFEWNNRSEMKQPGETSYISPGSLLETLADEVCPK